MESLANNGSWVPLTHDGSRLGTFTGYRRSELSLKVQVLTLNANAFIEETDACSGKEILPQGYHFAMQACMHVKCLPCQWKTRHVHACMSYSLTSNCHGNANLSCMIQVRVTSIYGTSIEDLIPGDSGGFGHAQFLPAAPVYQLPASSQPLHSSRNLLQVGTLSEFQSDANVAAQTCLKYIMNPHNGQDRGQKWADSAAIAQEL